MGLQGVRPSHGRLQEENAKNPFLFFIHSESYQKDINSEADDTSIVIWFHRIIRSERMIEEKSVFIASGYRPFISSTVTELDSEGWKMN